MRQFRWLSAVAIPWEHDLRRAGWVMHRDSGEAEGETTPLLGGMATIETAMWLRLLGATGPDLRGRVLLIGVDDPRERARLLHLGFGEVVANEVSLDGLDARAARIEARAGSVPRKRQVGPLTLDLVAREGFVDKLRLGLHPREFGLLWRLADRPGVAVKKDDLLSDVWRLGFVPETNSLAVHVSRLRAKLAQAGLGGLVRTVASGGYLLAPADATAPLPHERDTV